MQSLVSLEGYDPELRSYLEFHDWPTLMEALVSGLIVMLPSDPWSFIVSKLKEKRIRNVSHPLQWDAFIDPDVRPHQPLFRGVLDSYMDDTDLPTEEMFELAFDFRRKRLYSFCMKAWIEYHLMMKKENEEERCKMWKAQRHYNIKYSKIIISKWNNYAVLKCLRRKQAISKLRRLFHLHCKRTAFSSWQEGTSEARKAHLFFQNRVRNDAGRENNNDWVWPEGEDPISLLPRDVVIKIFCTLGIPALCRCSQVCRSWKDITEDTRLWNKVDLSTIGHYLSDQSVLQVFAKWRPLLGHLSLQSCVLLTSHSFQHIAQCQNLQDLNLSECKGITDEAIKCIVMGCSGLFYLNLSYCYVTDSIIRILTKYCISLNYLSLAYCTQFTGKGLQSIMAGKGCRKLVHLDLSGCTQLTQEAFQFLGQGCPILHTLILDDIDTLNDEAILTFVTHCHTLRHFSLLGSSSLTDRAFKHLALENRKLKSIKIENNEILTDITLRALSKACRDLQVIYLAGCDRITDQGLKSIGTLKKLHVLNIADCSRISDAGIRYVVDGANGQLLREFNITNCSKISDVTPLRISQHCHSLIHLNISYCENVSDTGIELLTQLPCLIDLDVTGSGLTDQGLPVLKNNKRIRHLSLAELYDITDDGIMKMVKGMTNIETINLSGCEALTDSSIQALAFNCQLLRQVHLAACPSIGDGAAKYLSQGCIWIRYIDLSGTSITDQALRHLGKNCHNLKQLDILSCVNVSKEAVIKLQRVCPTINYSTDPPQYMSTREDMPELPAESMLNRL